VLDEPTTGLHFDDVRKLLEVLNRLADAGHTLIVIEHNLDVIKCADWIIDLGPEGGERGGEVLAAGTPEKVAQNAASATGFYLQRMLSQAPPANLSKAGKKDRNISKSKSAAKASTQEKKNPSNKESKEPSANVLVKKSSKRASSKNM